MDTTPLPTAWLPAQIRVELSERKKKGTRRLLLGSHNQYIKADARD